MSQRPAVSVIVSTYNRAAVIPAALRALLEDQLAGEIAYEVIVVDNNSSDDTGEVLDHFSRTHPAMRWLSEPRQGVSYGRNAGIRAAEAPIVAFTDDDIRVAPDWIATIERLFDEHPGIDCIGGPVLPLWEAAPPAWLDARHSSPISVTDYGPAPFEISAAHPRCLLTSNLAMRARVFSRLEGFSPRFPRGQDHELQLRYWLAGGVALYSPDLVVRTEVPAARMQKAHHRRWHQLNGRVCARMWLRERCTSEGALLGDPVAGRTFLGVSRFLFRQLATALREWLEALGGSDASETFARELAVRHLVGYIAERRREIRGKRPRRASLGTAGAPHPLAGGESRAAVARSDRRESASARGRRPRLVLVYDGGCRVWARTVRIVRMLDVLHRVDARNALATWRELAAEFPDLRREACVGQLQLFSADGRRWRGFQACRALAWQVPAGWLLLPIAYLPGLATAGNAVCRAVAERRSRACLLVPDGAGE